MLGYKGFRKDLTCTMGKGTFRYEPGRWYDETLAHCGHDGFHATDNPLDVLSYYDVKDDRYFIVQLEGNIDEDGVNSRISAPRIRLLREISKRQLYKDGMMWIIEHQNAEWPSAVKKDTGHARGSGNVIVRGKNPRAAGELGDALFLLKEDKTGQITDAGAYIIDGAGFKPGTYYDVKGDAVDE